MTFHKLLFPIIIASVFVATEAVQYYSSHKKKAATVQQTTNPAP